MPEFNVVDFINELLNILSIISLIISILFYVRIKHEKSILEFLGNLISIHGSTSLKNTHEPKRRTYVRINNYCVIIIWMTIIFKIINLLYN